MGSGHRVLNWYRCGERLRVLLRHVTARGVTPLLFSGAKPNRSQTHGHSELSAHRSHDVRRLPAGIAVASWDAILLEIDSVLIYGHRSFISSPGTLPPTPRKMTSATVASDASPARDFRWSIAVFKVSGYLWVKLVLSAQGFRLRIACFQSPGNPL